MKVVDASDRRWKVRRRWLPWRRRVRDVPDVPFDGGGLGDDPISAIIGLFLLVLALPAIIVALVLLAELLLLLALLPLFVLGRLLLPVPWTIELWTRPATQRFLGWHLEHEVPVRGWSASGTRIGEMVAEIGRQDRGRRYVPREVRAQAEAEGTADDLREDWPVGAASVGSLTRDPEDEARTADRVPGDASPPARAGADVASGSPYGAAPVRPAGGAPATRLTDGAAPQRPAGDGAPPPNPFAQRGED